MPLLCCTFLCLFPINSHTRSPLNSDARRRMVAVSVPSRETPNGWKFIVLWLDCIIISKCLWRWWTCTLRGDNKRVLNALIYTKPKTFPCCFFDRALLWFVVLEEGASSCSLGCVFVHPLIRGLPSREAKRDDKRSVASSRRRCHGNARREGDKVRVVKRWLLTTRQSTWVKGIGMGMRCLEWDFHSPLYRLYIDFGMIGNINCW